MRVKKNLTFDESVLGRVEQYALQNGISLSAAFAVLVISALDAIAKEKSAD